MEAHIELAYHLGFYFFNYYSKYKDKIHYNIKKKKKAKSPHKQEKSTPQPNMERNKRAAG